MSAWPQEGDLGIVTTKSGDEFRGIYLLAPGIDYFWHAIDGMRTNALKDPDVSARPLVVIDPEDAEQVDRLATTLASNMGVAKDGTFRFHRYDLALALEEFACPPDPKPEEPPGLGALVEARWVEEGFRDTHLRTWAKSGDGSWVSLTDGTVGRSAPWGFLGDVRVLSEGVPA